MKTLESSTIDSVFVKILDDLCFFDFVILVLPPFVLPVLPLLLLVQRYRRKFRMVAGCLRTVRS